MNNINKTLYIPLYGKAYVSKKGIILHDSKAEEIWSKEGFHLKGKSSSKWLAYSMGMRSRVFDRWLSNQLEKKKDAVVLHLGCGMDSRCARVVCHNEWFDVDFPSVIEERKRYYSPTERYHMIASDIRDSQWLNSTSKKSAVIIMEGISMYLSPDELKKLLKKLDEHFEEIALLMDYYTVIAAKASKYKNPINDVGVTQVYGLDNPKELLKETSISYCGEVLMTPDDLINQLSGMEKTIFRNLYAGNIARKMYRMVEFEK
ncbi:MAG: class I SAM-dependent methyltransferase [Erysipelotrichaceae bacterium]|nr:class I SAM-dependent methyltransferase [Erysipelotrichaceae bacterium]